MEAFEAYDFAGDERWARHLAAVELPPQVDPTGGDSRAVRLVKAKWYKREVDSEFDVDLVRNTKTAPAPGRPEPTRPAASERPSHQQQPPPRSQPRTQGAPASARQTTLLVVLHAALVVFSVGAVVPLPTISQRCFLWGLQVAAAVHGQKLYNTYGLPSIRPFPNAIKEWAQRAGNCTDFHYLVLAVTFMAGRPMLVVLMPMAILAVYHLFHYGSSNYGAHSLWQKYGARAHSWLQERRQQALLFNALSEISVGFLTVFALLSPARSLTQCYAIWSVLKARYRCPDSSWYHQNVWGLINEKTRPFYSRVSLVSQGVGLARRWFLGVN